MSKSVFCIVSDITQAEALIDNLRLAGFTNSDVSVLMPDQGGIRDLVPEKHSKAPEGAATGAGLGAVAGGALGWLAGIGALALPGMGPFIAAGPIMAFLSGAAVGGATGGAAGGLIGLGIPEYEAKQYEGKLREGKILISVHCDNKEEIEMSEKIMKAADANDIHTAAEEGVKQDRKVS